MATGFAFPLLGGGAAAGRVLVPLSYRRFRARGPLPRRVVSHVRRQPGSRSERGVLDATLSDETGRVVAEIEGYVVRAVDPRVLTPKRASEDASAPLRAWVEQGIAPEEGFDMLCRVLARGVPPRILVSPRNLPAAVAELREPPVPDAKRERSPAGLPTGDDAPRDDVERELAAMWGALLGVANVGRSDDFFEIGGHSLVAVRLFARVRKTFGVDLPLATLFEAPTIDSLARILRSQLDRPSPEEVAATNADLGSARWR